MATKRRVLTRTQFGNPLLRQPAKRLAAEEIKSVKIKRLISDMRYTLDKKKYGVGLAAPQVGYEQAISIIEIKSTRYRPNIPKNKWVSMVMINPKIIETYGRRTQLWEGCLSFAEVFAKVPRYKKIRLSFLDEQGKTHRTDFKGLLAHVIQHEVDHLNGVLFVDRVEDKSTFITQAEYIKRIVKPRLKNDK